MSKIVSVILVALLISSCATQVVKELDLSNGKPDTAVLSVQCNPGCEAAIASSFTYGKRYFDSGIGPALLYEVNGLQGSQTFRCADCVGTVVNAFNDSWSGGFRLIIPAGETSLTVSVSDFRVSNKSKYKVAFQAVAGRTYALLQVQKNPLQNEDSWMPVIVDTVENKIAFPRDGTRWLRR